MKLFYLENIHVAFLQMCLYTGGWSELQFQRSKEEIPERENIGLLFQDNSFYLSFKKTFCVFYKTQPILKDLILYSYDQHMDLRIVKSK